MGACLEGTGSRGDVLAAWLGSVRTFLVVAPYVCAAAPHTCRWLASVTHMPKLAALMQANAEELGTLDAANNFFNERFDVAGTKLVLQNHTAMAGA